MDGLAKVQATSMLSQTFNASTLTVAGQRRPCCQTRSDSDCFQPDNSPDFIQETGQRYVAGQFPTPISKEEKGVFPRHYSLVMGGRSYQPATAKQSLIYL